MKIFPHQEHNMKQIKQLTTVLCLLLNIINATSCSKNSEKLNGTFTLTGRLMDSCDGRGLANVLLKIRFINTYYFDKLHSKDSIGLGTTDTNGYFSIICKNWGRGEIIIHNYARVIIGTNDNPKGATINIGNTYQYKDKLNEQATLKLRISGTYSPSDTLYIGGKLIYPITTETRFEYLVFPNKQEDNISFDEALNQPKPTTIYWAIGKTAYDSVVKNKVVAHQLSVPFTVCGVPEVITEVDIKN
jgi:hypothetical protein